MLLRSDFRNQETALVSGRKVSGQVLWIIVPAIALVLGWGYGQFAGVSSRPQAIFVLGGHENRERAAAKLAQKHPSLPVWVSSGSPENYVKRIFRRAGISPQRLHLSYQAKDTVTNFTTLADTMKAENIKSVYLVTSEGHMGRAQLVGEVIFGSRGIAIVPISVPSPACKETPNKSLRDLFRALLWVMTGRTGETLINHSS